MTEAAAITDATATAATSAATETQTTQIAQSTSIMAQAGAENPNDWLPEKHRVSKEDGSIDTEASAKKLAESYRNLEKRIGSGDVRPATAEEYAPELAIEGITFDDIKGDELYQDFAKKAHEAGFTNAQVTLAVNEFLSREIGAQAGTQAQSMEEATAALREVWKSDAEFGDGLADMTRAIRGPMQERLMEKYGNDPDFIMFAASVGKEMREDSSIPSNSQVSEQDFNIRAGELRTQLSGMDRYDPQRPKVQAELDSLYTKRVGKGAAAQGFTITI